MKSKLMVLFLLAGSSMFAGTRFVVGWGGYYPAPPAPLVAYAAPVAPGPGYAWVGGYWYPNGPRYAWRAGYWARPPYARAVWVGPRWYGSRYYYGGWRR